LPNNMAIILAAHITLPVTNIIGTPPFSARCMAFTALTHTLLVHQL